MPTRSLAPLAVWFLVVGSAFLDSSRAANPVSMETAWEQAEVNLFNEAHTAFKKLKGQRGVDERERGFGEAVTLLNVQPRTPGNITRAEKMFAALAEEDDLYGYLASYYLARIWEDYTSPPQIDRAKVAYRELLKKNTGNPLVEGSAVRLALIEEASERDPAKRQEVLLAARSLAENLQTREGRRDFHLNLGLALVKAGDLSAGLEELLAADAEGITSPLSERGAWITIAEAARLSGKKEIAAEYYRKFLKKYERDVRSHTLAEHLAEIEASESPAP